MHILLPPFFDAFLLAPTSSQLGFRSFTELAVTPVVVDLPDATLVACTPRSGFVAASTLEIRFGVVAFVANLVVDAHAARVGLLYRYAWSLGSTYGGV